MTRYIGVSQDGTRENVKYYYLNKDDGISIETLQDDFADCVSLENKEGDKWMRLQKKDEIITVPENLSKDSILKVFKRCPDARNRKRENNEDNEDSVIASFNHKKRKIDQDIVLDVLENLDPVKTVNYKYVSKDDILEILKEKPKYPFPVTSNYYDLATKSLENTTKNMIDELIVKENEPSHHLFIAVDNVCSIESDDFEYLFSETDITSVYHTLFNKIITGFRKHGEIELLTQISLDSIPKDESKKIRDFVCTFENVTVIFGEEMATKEDMPDSVDILEKNIGLVMLDEFYGEIPFVLGYAAAGEQIKFYAFIRRIRNSDESKEKLKRPKFVELATFSFDSLSDRLKMFMFMINTLRFFDGCMFDGLFPAVTPWVSTIPTPRPPKHVD